MLPQEIIRKKRDGQALDDAEIAFFVEGLTAGRITEGQAAAFAMAVFFNGMSRAEIVALTRAMAGSGTRLDWRDLDGPVVDKHSTGGVGDKVSLVLAPILAACGAYVPMISGRGLGHTGGTLDKMDSIPGYETAPDLAGLRRTVRAAGCAIIGQTAELAPADRRLYAIRDVTATVETIPLLVSSILSKKLAAGLDALVMDVKVGSGAFLPSLAAAHDLATSLVGSPTAPGSAVRPCSPTWTSASAAPPATRWRCARRSTSWPGAARSPGCGRSPWRSRRSCWRSPAAATTPPCVPSAPWTAAPRPSASAAWCGRSAVRTACSSGPSGICRARRCSVRSACRAPAS